MTDTTGSLFSPYLDNLIQIVFLCTTAIAIMLTTIAVLESEIWFAVAGVVITLASIGGHMYLRQCLKRYKTTSNTN